MTCLPKNICIFITLLALSLPLVRGQFELPSSGEIYNLTKKMLNATQYVVEGGTNVTETVFNSSVLVACETSELFLDRGVYGALSAIFNGKGGTYPLMAQCVDGCLFRIINMMVKPILKIINILNPIKLPKPRIIKAYNGCFFGQLFSRDACNMINNMKRCLLIKLPFLSKFIVRNMDNWIDTAKKVYKLNYDIFPLFPDVKIRPPTTHSPVS